MKDIINQIKRKKQVVGSLLLAVLVLGACSEMDDNFEPYIKNGEIIYTLKPLDVAVRSGNERVELTWKMTNIHNVTEAVVTYGEGDQDQVIVAIDGQQDTVKTVNISGLEENTYQFSVYTKNNSGLQSIKSENVTGIVYGESYRSGLIPRSSSVFFDRANNGYMDWSVGNDLTRKTEVKYTNMEGSEVVVEVGADQLQSTISNVSTVHPILRRTYYVPTPAVDGEETAIDEFASDWKPVSYSPYSGYYQSTGQMEHYGLSQPVTWQDFEKKYNMVDETTIVGRLGNNWPSSRGWKIRIKINEDNSLTLSPADGLSDTLEKVPDSVNAYDPSTKELTLNYRIRESGGYISFNETLVFQ